MSSSRAVNQYSKTGDFIKQYPSLVAASEAVNREPQSISKCCKGKRFEKLCGGYFWRFADEEPDMWQISPKTSPVRQYTLGGVLVAEYVNIEAAQKALGDMSLNIYCACKRIPGLEVAGGYLWSWATEG